MTIYSPLERFLQFVKSFNRLLHLPAFHWWRKNFRSLPKRLIKVYKVFSVWDWLVFLLGIGFVALGFYLGIFQTKKAAIFQSVSRGGEISIALPEVPKDFLKVSGNPSEEVIKRLIFAPLFEVEEGGKLTPILAENLSWDSEHKVLTIKLKSSRFSNGREVTASDVIYSVQKIINEKGAYARLFSNTSFEALDNLTVQFTLSESYSFFEYYLDFPIYPSEIEHNKRVDTIAASGPFYIAKVAETKNRGEIKRIDFVANKNYVLGQPKIQKIKLFFFPSASEAQAAYLNKKVSILLSRDSIQEKGLPGKQIEFASLDKLVIFLNVEKPPLSEANLRKNLVEGVPFSSATELTLLMPDTLTAQKSLSSHLKEAINVNAKEITLSPKDFLEEVIKKEYHLVALDLNFDSKLDYYPYFHSSQSLPEGRNFSNLKDKEVDHLIEEIRHNFDLNQRTNQQNQLENLLRSKFVYLVWENPPLFLSVSNNLTLLGLESFKISAWSDIFKGVEKWQLGVK